VSAYVALLDGGAREERIEVTRTGPGTYEVRLRGKVHAVDAFRHDHGTLSLLVDGESYAATLDERGAKVHVRVRGSVHPVELLSERRLRLRRAPGTLTLPGKATVGSLPAGREGTIGNGFLKDNFDAAAQLDGYFYFVAKGQGATGVARAVAISSFLAFATPAVVGPDGRPAGTRSAPATPTPPKPPTPGEETVDGGYDLPVDIRTPSGTVLDNVLFTIRSGFERSLISRSLAALLGIDLGSLPSAVDEGNFGALPVLLTPLTLQLFDDPSFPSFILDVGIVQNPSDDPFGENILGADLLSQLAYWEIFYGTDGPAAIFYAAAAIDTVPAPAPGSALLLAGALPLLARGLRRR